MDEKGMKSEGVVLMTSITSGGLAHQDACCRGKLVGNRYDSSGKFSAAAIEGSSVVLLRSESGAANHHVHESLAPWPPERVGYDDRATSEFLSEARGGSVWILWQHAGKIIAFDVCGNSFSRVDITGKNT